MSQQIQQPETEEQPAPENRNYCVDEKCEAALAAAAELCCFGRYEEVGEPIFQHGIDGDSHLLWCARCGRLGIINGDDGRLETKAPALVARVRELEREMSRTDQLRAEHRVFERDWLRVLDELRIANSDGDSVIESIRNLRLRAR